MLGYNAAGQLSDKDFLVMNKECDKEIEEAERQIYELEQQQLSKEEFRKHIDTIRRVLHDAEQDADQGIINKDFIDKYIDKILSPRRQTAPCACKSKFSLVKLRTSISLNSEVVRVTR